MGITGLLPLLEGATKNCHISEFRGGTAAVDTYCWLHRGANACAEKLARGEDSDVYVNYCLKYVKMLLSYNIHPIMVFDGKNLPAKSDTELKRREGRQKAKQRAAELLRLGKTDEARNYFKQCVDITPKMALNLIKECRKLNVDCIVAPYESDAQLAFFNLKGIADVIITEDSDLILFGCKKVMYKMDLTGRGQLVEADFIYKALKLRPDQYSFEKFRHMCILSGCDYLNSLPGIGLKKALKFVTLTAETDPQIFLDRLPRYLNMRHLEVTPAYKECFMIAEATFRHQTVFDPFKKKLVPLVDPEASGTEEKFCKNAGDIFDHKTAFQMALGNLHPNSLEKLDNWSPQVNIGFSRSIWSGTYKKSAPRNEIKAEKQAQIKESPNKSIKMEVDDEKIKMEEQNQMDEELEYYNPAAAAARKATLDESLQLEEEKTKLLKKENERISPVLGTKYLNPFIKKKKSLSKFQTTSTVKSNVIVRSRFFYSSETVKSEETLKSVTTDSDIENIPDNSDKNDNNLDELEEIQEIVVKKRSSIYLEEATASEGLIKSMDIDLTQKETLSFCQSSSQPVLPSESNVTKKRKLLGPCKTIGLSKKAAGQQTLQHFFNKMKKN